MRQCTSSAACRAGPNRTRLVQVSTRSGEYREPAGPAGEPSRRESATMFSITSAGRRLLWLRQIRQAAEPSVPCSRSSRRRVTVAHITSPRLSGSARASATTWRRCPAPGRRARPGSPRACTPAAPPRAPRSRRRRLDQEGVVHRRADGDPTLGGEAARQPHHLGAVRLHREVHQRARVRTRRRRAAASRTRSRSARQLEARYRLLGPAPEARVGRPMQRSSSRASRSGRRFGRNHRGATWSFPARRDGKALYPPAQCRPYRSS